MRGLWRGVGERAASIGEPSVAGSSFMEISEPRNATLAVVANDGRAAVGAFGPARGKPWLE